MLKFVLCKFSFIACAKTWPLVFLCFCFLLDLDAPCEGNKYILCLHDFYSLVISISISMHSDDWNPLYLYAPVWVHPHSQACTHLTELDVNKYPEFTFSR